MINYLDKSLKGDYCFKFEIIRDQVGFQHAADLYLEKELIILYSTWHTLKINYMLFGFNYSYRLRLQKSFNFPNLNQRAYPVLLWEALQQMKGYITEVRYFIFSS